MRHFSPHPGAKRHCSRVTTVEDIEDCKVNYFGDAVWCAEKTSYTTEFDDFDRRNAQVGAVWCGGGAITVALNERSTLCSEKNIPLLFSFITSG